MCANCLRSRALNTSRPSLQYVLQDSLHDYLSYINSLLFFIYYLFFSEKGSTLETLDFTIRIGIRPKFSYFDLYLYFAYAAHYV